MVKNPERLIKKLKKRIADLELAIDLMFRDRDNLIKGILRELGVEREKHND